jgi:hypothetical protein
MHYLSPLDIVLQPLELPQLCLRIPLVPPLDLDRANHQLGQGPSDELRQRDRRLDLQEGGHEQDKMHKCEVGVVRFRQGAEEGEVVWREGEGEEEGLEAGENREERGVFELV